MTLTSDTHNNDLSVTVFVVDDDSSIRAAMVRLLHAAGLRSSAFDSVDAFLEQTDIPRNSCVVSDVRMPGKSGLALPGLLAARGLNVPVIFITAYDTDQARTEARRAGAAGFFSKPIDDHALLDAIAWSLGEPDQPTPFNSWATD